MTKLFKSAALMPFSLTVLVAGLLCVGNVRANCDAPDAAAADLGAEKVVAEQVAEAACAGVEDSSGIAALPEDAGIEVVGPREAEPDFVEPDDESGDNESADEETADEEIAGQEAGDNGSDENGSSENGLADKGPARVLLDDFSGDLESLQLQFTQMVKSQDGRIQDETGGHATLQNPDRLYWVYEGDFPETIVADGNTVWIYDEALDQVTVRPQSASISDTPLMILTDISQLDETFQATELGDFENMQLLELRSRDEESEFERIILGLDSEGIKMMVMEDAYGQRTEIHFSDIVKNADIDTGLFNFVPPEGVDVVGELPEPQ